MRLLESRFFGQNEIGHFAIELIPYRPADVIVTAINID